jgi:hypothetical protein
VIAASSLASGDILAAASLLLAILAVLYSLWYSDIQAALRIDVPTHLEDAGPQRRQVSEALTGRALPLAASAIVLLLIFLPEAIHIIWRWYQLIAQYGVWRAIKNYDPVILSIIAVVTSLALLAGYTSRLVVQLWHLRTQLRN